MCALFSAGSEELRWGSKQLAADGLRVVRERAMWELSKLVTPASGHLQGDSLISFTRHLCTHSCPQALLPCSRKALLEATVASGMVHRRCAHVMGGLMRTTLAAAGASLVLASHLPWLLHLLLLTNVGAAPEEDTSARSAEAFNEASENLSATTVQRVASSGMAGGQPLKGMQSQSPRGLESLSQGGHSLSMASSHVSDSTKVRAAQAEM